MDQDHEDFEDDEQEDEEDNPPQQDPPAKVKYCLRNPCEEMVPLTYKGLDPPGIHDVYFHLTRMAGINLINAHSSQPILSCEDQAAFQILTTMY